MPTAHLFMFVSVKIHQQALQELAAERAKYLPVAEALAAARREIEWLYLRVNQLEKERAILFRQVTHLPIPVPEIVLNPIPTSADHVLTGKDLWGEGDTGEIVD